MFVCLCVCFVAGKCEELKEQRVYVYVCVRVLFLKCVRNLKSRGCVCMCVGTVCVCMCVLAEICEK